MASTCFLLLLLGSSTSIRRSSSIASTDGADRCPLCCTYCAKLTCFICLNFSPMSLLFHRTRLKSRYILSIFVGLSLGFALSLACLPLMSVCDNPLSLFAEPFSSRFHTRYGNDTFLFLDKFDPFRLLNRQSRSVVDVTLVDYRSEDYEPRVLPSPGSVQTDKDNNSLSSSTTTASTLQKVVRPRYIADELGIREKVLVAVLTQPSHLHTFALFFNQTLQEHVNRVLFFIDEDTQDFPRGMQVVAIHDRRAYLKPFYVLKYLAEKMIKLYDWFVLVPDNTYVRGFKVRRTSAVDFLHASIRVLDSSMNFSIISASVKICTWDKPSMMCMPCIATMDRASLYQEYVCMILSARRYVPSSESGAVRSSHGYNAVQTR